MFGFILGYMSVRFRRCVKCMMWHWTGRDTSQGTTITTF